MVLNVDIYPLVESSVTATMPRKRSASVNFPVIRGFLVRRQMKHQWEIVESQRKYIASFLSDIQLKGETLIQTLNKCEEGCPDDHEQEDEEKEEEEKEKEEVSRHQILFYLVFTVLCCAPRSYVTCGLYRHLNRCIPPSSYITTN
eukprot:XP_011665235.1 PREDICTED: putative F-box protein At1g47300 [Strongylocentrotus purpuratus]